MVCLPLFFKNEHHIFVAVTHRNQSLFLPWAGDILIANLPRAAIDSCHKAEWERTYALQENIHVRKAHFMPFSHSYFKKQEGGG